MKNIYGWWILKTVEFSGFCELESIGVSSSTTSVLKLNILPTFQALSKVHILFFFIYIKMRLYWKVEYNNFSTIREDMISEAIYCCNVEFFFFSLVQ